MVRRTLARVCLALVSVLGLSVVPASAAPEAKSYVVVFKQHDGLPTDADAIIARAGGTIVHRLDRIGVVRATSTSSNFLTGAAAAPSILTAGEDTDVPLIPGLATLADAENSGGAPTPPGIDPQPGTDNLYAQQWDKMRMNAALTGSYAVQRGRRDVVVALLDSGVEVTHPDIAPNLDVARSRSFVASEPDIDDRNGHGSWIASAIGAPINVVGISGVAPQVTLVALKVARADGRGSLVDVAAALVYAGDNHFDVANMSLGGFLERDQANPTIKAVQRGINYARANGTTPVAALLNDGRDLSDGSTNKNRILVPGELAGVIGVSATGYANQKAYYSNYGTSTVDVAAPGGDRLTQPPPPTYHGGGRVLGAWSRTTIGLISPALREEQCDPVTGVCYYYAWVQGTSMASANAAGVAALIVSQYGDFRNSPQKPHMSPTEVESILQITANILPCGCQGGGAGHNEHFGKGLVDALKAVTLGGNR